MRMINKSSFVAFLLMACCSFATAQGLLQDFQRAQDFDPVFAASRVENQANQLQAKIAGMAYYPEARISSSQLDNENSSRTTLSVSQPILSYDRWLSLKESDPRMALAGAKLEQSQYDLAQRLFKAVSTLVEAREKLALNANSLKALETEVLSARRAFELGMGTITDVRDTEVRLAQTKSQSFTLKVAVSAAEREYFAVVGQPPQSMVYALKTQPHALKLPPLNEFMARAEQRSPAIRSSALSLSLAEIGIKRARAALFPSVMAVAQRSQRSGSPATSNSGITLRMEIPLQAGTFYKGSSAELELKKTEELARNALQQVRLDVERFYNQVEAVQSELLARAESIKASELSLNANEQSFVGGVRTKLDVLNAMQALLQSRSDYATAQLRLGEAWLALLIVSAADTDVALTQVHEMIFVR